MDLFINFFLTYLLLYKYITLFILVFLAGFIVPIPVAILLVAVGAFSTQNYFSLNASFLVATVANTMGDMFAYLFFYKFGHSILHDKFINKYSFFTRLEQFFKQNIYISIFISRIIVVFGTPVNFLSGFFKVSFLEFSFFSLLGNFIFVMTFLILGYIVGDKWEDISNFINTTMGGLSIIIMIIIFTLYKKKNHKTS